MRKLSPSLMVGRAAVSHWICSRDFFVREVRESGWFLNEHSPCPAGIESEGEDGSRLAARRVTCARVPRMRRESKILRVSEACREEFDRLPIVPITIRRPTNN